MLELFPRLRERLGQKAGTLPRRAADGGHGAGTDGAANILLMDEPSMGLAPILVEQVFKIIKEISGSRA